MVKELEIADWEPSDISDMIEGEISALIPAWNGDPHKLNLNQHEEDDHNHSFHSLSSSSSSQISFSGVNVSRQTDGMVSGCDWLQGRLQNANRG